MMLVVARLILNSVFSILDVKSLFHLYDKFYFVNLNNNSRNLIILLLILQLVIF